MTNLEAWELLRIEKEQSRKDPNFSPTLDFFFDVVRLYDIKERAEENPQIWEEEYIPSKQKAPEYE